MVSEINSLCCSELHQSEGLKSAYYLVTKAISLETMGWFFL